jgi:SulP family sulfate permease
LIAGITVAVILLPQAIAFALIAELPPQMGLYAGIVGALIGALWGSSNQIHTGPANAISLLIFGSLISFVEPGTPEFMLAAGLMAVMVGVFQLFMGLLRLGMLVNFVSHSVIVGFATGAGILIGIKQIEPLLGISFASRNTWEVMVGVWQNAPDTHLYTAVLGIGTMILMAVIRKINPAFTLRLIVMIVASLVVFIFRLDQQGVSVIGELPKSLPPIANLPILDLDLISRLSTAALTAGAIALVQTMAISRSFAVQTGQRLDSNQEFVGQGMANIFMGIFSGFAGAGSFLAQRGKL